LFSAMFSLN